MEYLPSPCYRAREHKHCAFVTRGWRGHEVGGGSGAEQDSWCGIFETKETKDKHGTAAELVYPEDAEVLTLIRKANAQNKISHSDIADDEDGDGEGEGPGSNSGDH